MAGFAVDGVPSKDVAMDETVLYFGQYIESKFLVERAVLEATMNGLDAKIMCVGNLMARNKDGEFQINAKANSFLGKLRAYYAIGCFPYSLYNSPSVLASIVMMLTMGMSQFIRTDGKPRISYSRQLGFNITIIIIPHN